MPVAETVIVDLIARSEKFSAALAKTQRDFDRRVSAMEVRAASGGAAIVGKLGAAFKGFLGFEALRRTAAFVADAADELATIGEQAARIGITTKALQELQYAGEQAELSAQDVSNMMEFFGRQVGNASRGVGDLNKILRENKIAIGSVSEVLPAYADLIQRATPEQRQVLIQAAFGRGAREAGTLFDQGAAGIRRWGDEAERIGGIVSDETIRKAAVLDEKFTALTRTIGTFFKTLAVGAADAAAALASSEKAGEEAGIALAERLLSLTRGAEAAAKTVKSFRMIGAGGRFDDVVGDPNAPVRSKKDLFPGASVKLPSTGGGGGGGAASQDNFKSGLEALIQRTEALDLEFRSLGRNRGEIEKRRAALELEQEAISAGIPITKEMRTQIEQWSEQLGLQVQRLEEAEAAMERVNEAAQASFDVVKQGFMDVITGAESFEDALKNVIKQFAAIALNNAFNMLFSPTGGAGGGIFRFLGGILGGGGGGGLRVPRGASLGGGGGSAPVVSLRVIPTDQFHIDMDAISQRHSAQAVRVSVETAPPETARRLNRLQRDHN